MAINISILSHAFFTQKDLYRVIADDDLPESLEVKVELERDSEDCSTLPPTTPRFLHGQSASSPPISHRAVSPGRGVTPVGRRASSPHRVASPSRCSRHRSNAASPSDNINTLPIPATPSPRVKSSSRRRRNRKRDSRSRGSTHTVDKLDLNKVNMVASEAGTETSPDSVSGRSSVPSGPVASSPDSSCLNSHGDLDVIDVPVDKLREKCSKVLGIVTDDLELFSLRHIPHSENKSMLFKDKSGMMHLGVMVRNSELDLQKIEELLIGKSKAEENAEKYCQELKAKSEDFKCLQTKYDTLTTEVMRLRTMVTRANQLRRESEKAADVLRVEFEKLVKNLFLDRPGDKTQHHDGGEGV